MAGPPNQACFDPKGRDKSGHLCLHRPLCVSLLEQCTHSDLPSESSVVMFPASLLSTCYSPNVLGVPGGYVFFAWPVKLPSTVTAWHMVGAL